ncbi:MAG: ABC transporter substrate-binding protein [Candidatus Binatia bacterium]
MIKQIKCICAIVLLLSICALSSSSAVNAQTKTKVRIATASPSLSYLPIYAAVKKGFFAKRGFDVEMIQMSASLTAAARELAARK